MRMLNLLFFCAVLVGSSRLDARTLEQLEQAAARGDVIAMDTFGYMYHNGAGGVQKDEAKSMAWYRKAAEGGFAPAQFRLGYKYTFGDGVEKDNRMAARWYEKASVQGNSEAQFNLGIMYEQPDVISGEEATGVPKNYAKAAEQYQKAAVQGHAKANYRLALLYERGFGVPQSDAKAFELIEKSAKLGFADAQMMVGLSYEEGHQVQKDSAKAYAWYNVAAAMANDSGFTTKKEAEKERDKIEKLLIPQQMAEAQKLSAELFAKMPKK